MKHEYDDKTLRKAFASLAREPRPREGCPPPERLWAAIRTELDVAKRLEVLDHTTTCPACAEDWRMAVVMGAQPPSRWSVVFEDIKETLGKIRDWAPTGGGQMFRLHRGTLAFAGVFVLALSILVPSLIKVDPPSEKPIYRGSTIEAQTATDIPLSREDCRLQWLGPGDALFYDLKIMTESLEPVVMVEGLESAEYKLSIEDLEGVATGEHLLWKVVAILPNGEQITSPSFVSKLK